ncbi:hypothetical protein LSH36_1555g00000 [Paralvinella palmiformis]|uniref:DDE Tnp4 domain-containing protein n=1 Tax=Paralvinella palmiformis TaxID=53620 RepID=A0AAD9ISU0_9ANNE|nr:hypothetical protein LSH36_1555g00000 [Paralvinella palmiformis]
MVKVFIVCSPLGAVTYLSTAWGGRASDVEMVRASDFISSKFHQPCDQLLADRGFTMVEEFVKQLSPKEVEVSCKSVRIHIGWVIGLLKNDLLFFRGRWQLI